MAKEMSLLLSDVGQKASGKEDSLIHGDVYCMNCRTFFKRIKDYKLHKCKKKSGGEDEI